MSIYDWRVYTFASREDLDVFKDVVYPRHLNGSFPKHGIRPHGFFVHPDDDRPRMFVLVSLPDGTDPDALAKRYVRSPEFREEVEGFDLSTILNVESLILRPTASSPLQ
jgi:hypothetical protein